MANFNNNLIALHLRNASTPDAQVYPYKIPPSLKASQESGYFVLQYKIESLDEEEYLQLETGYKMSFGVLEELEEEDERLLLNQLKYDLRELDSEIGLGDRDHYKILAPLADDAWLIRSSKKLEELRKIENVYFVDHWHPAFKLSTSLFDAIIKTGTNSEQKEIGLLLSLFPNPNTNEIQSLIKNLGGESKVGDQIIFKEGKESTQKVIGARVSLASISEIAKLKDVHLIEEASMPGMELMNAHGVTGVNAARITMAAIIPVPPGLDGTGETIGIYDTGVDTGTDNGVALVPDLNGRVAGDTHPWNNNVGAVQSWADRNYNGLGGVIFGHGTSVTGIAIGNGVISGVAHAANAIIRPWSADFNNAWPVQPMTFDITIALRNAYAANARIHNDSWGETSGPHLNNLNFFTNQYRSSDRIIDQFTKEYPEMLVVTSAGNRGVNGPSTITSPGTGKNVLTVGSSGNGNPLANNNILNGTLIADIANTSSRGPAPANKLKPDVVAPGDKIAAIRAQGIVPGQGVPAIDNKVHNLHNQYSYGGGTSFAAPYVSGMAALIRQFLRNNAFHNGNINIGQRNNPSGMLVKALIINGAQSLDPNVNDIPNNDEGYGLVNLDQSINPNRLKLVYDSRDPNDQLNNGERFSLGKWIDTEKTFQLNNVDNDIPISITLVWYDLPDGAATGALMCDLDLILRKTDTRDIYRGGVPGFANGESRRLNTNGLKRNRNLRDRSNAVEKIYIQNPAAGNYTIQVKARSIPFGLPVVSVPFALVVAQG